MIDVPSSPQEASTAEVVEKNPPEKSIESKAEGTATSDVHKDIASEDHLVQPTTTSAEMIDAAATAEPAELDIDSMLKNLVNQGGGVDPTATNPEDGMNIDIGGFEDSGDVTSLLPGPENYTNLPAASASSEQTDKAGTDNEKSKETNPEDDGMGGLDMADSNFDELFNIDGLDFGDNGNSRSNSMDGNMDIGEFMEF
jgi:hypothetical protein